MKKQTYKKFLDVKGRIFNALCLISTFIGIVAVFGLLIYVCMDAIGWFNFDFLTNSPSRFPEKAGVYPLIIGSFMVIAVVGIMSLPVGVGAAIFLEEYSNETKLRKFIEMNIANLAGVPSIVYGLLGLGIFVTLFNFPPGIVIVGALTLTLRILPIIIVSAQEAIRSVPDSLREASYGLGASKWQTIKNIVLPESAGGIMTGAILALANALGETAPLIMIGAATSIFSPPTGLTSPFGALPLQIFAWSDFPKAEFQHGVTPAAIVTLLIILVLMNSFAVFIRNRYQRQR